MDRKLKRKKLRALAELNKIEKELVLKIKTKSIFLVEDLITNYNKKYNKHLAKSKILEGVKEGALSVYKDKILKVYSTIIKDFDSSKFDPINTLHGLRVLKSKMLIGKCDNMDKLRVLEYEKQH